MKSMTLVLAAAVLAATATPVLAASNIAVPTAATAPSVDPRSDDTTFDPAAIAQLGWNSTQSRDANEETTARISTDGKFIYVRFDAAQNERIASESVTGASSDGDLVWIDLQPGANAPSYRFVANPSGASGATASGSSAAPAFTAAGATYDGGYTVTMKIPLAQLSGAQSGSWSAQFGRTVHATGQQFVWSHDGNVAQAGTLTMPASVGVAP